MASLPTNYALFNNEKTKNIAVVVDIDGVDLLSSTTLFEKIRYGDPNLVYGQPGIVYGGLRAIPGIRPYLDISKSSIAITQQIEPEQGRGSVSQLTLTFIDKDGYMTKVLSPGVIVDEILGREVNVYLGYQAISYPEDYYRIYRGYISDVSVSTGYVTLTISDPNIKRRQDIFIQSTGLLGADITDTDTTILCANSDAFYSLISNWDGNPADLSVSTFIKIDNEIIGYPISSNTGGMFTSVSRGFRGTVAAAHTEGAQITNTIEFFGNVIDIALKLMLSGWDGPYLTDVPAQSFVNPLDSSIGFDNNIIVLSGLKDAVKDYGLSIGDYLQIRNSTNSGNNGICHIIGFEDSSGVTNHIIITDKTFTLEYPSTAVMDFRSQYDVYPVLCGAKMTPQDVDVAGHIFIKNTFLDSAEDQFKFYVTAQQAAKTFIESSIYLPMGAYSITRNGKLSVGLSQPPIAGSSLNILDNTNVIQPISINQSRSLNSGRKFWNDISFNYEFDDSGNATQIYRVFDATSFGLIGVRQSLPIDAPGAKLEFSADSFFQKRAELMLSRFSRGATMINIMVNWGVGNTIEAGDIIAVNDPGTLQIANFSTGNRALGFQLFEVINRRLDIQTGNCTLTLLNGVGSEAGDRYGVIAPSSIIGTGSTTTQIQIIDSFGYPDVGNEVSKWTAYVGNDLLIHDENFTTSYETKLISIDTSTRRFITVSPALPAAPSAGWLVDLDNYSNSTDPTVDQASKVIHCFFSPDITVVSGLSISGFTVASGDIGKFNIGNPILVHDENFVIASPETTISAIDTTGYVITTTDSLGFTPSGGNIASMLGFPDGSACYRWL